jgi:hypothetical protein
MSIARMEDAQRSNQSKRGWDLRPEPSPAPITIIRVLEVLFRPASLISLLALAACVSLWVFY